MRIISSKVYKECLTTTQVESYQLAQAQMGSASDPSFSSSSPCGPESFMRSINYLKSCCGSFEMVMFMAGTGALHIGQDGSTSRTRFISEKLQHILQLGHCDHSDNTICFPEARQKGKFYLQLGQSRRVSGISNLQFGHCESGSASSSAFTGRRAIPSILGLNFGGI